MTDLARWRKLGGDLAAKPDCENTECYGEICVEPERCYGEGQRAELTPERLAELRRIAEAATPGPLTMHLCDDARYAAFVDAPHLGPDAPELAVFLIERDARFFAEFDRDTALALLDEIERLQQKVQRANALAVAAEQVLKAWSMGDYLTPFMDDLRNALLDFEEPVASGDGWLEVATDGEEGGASDA